MEKLKNTNSKVNKEEIIEGLFEDPFLRDFFLENDLNSMVIEENLSNLLAFQNQNNLCEKCDSLKDCKQDTIGLKPILKYDDDKIKLFYNDCNYKLHKDKLSLKDELINAMFMPKMIYDATLEDYKTNTDARMDIYKYIMRFLKIFPMGEKMKGLYIWGEYQKGKTYTLAATANELTNLGYNVIIAYYPDLVRELKSAIGNNTLESLISKLKQTDILMLDDIGGEAQSSWIRDEVLGPILQYRLLDERPTFFTSNVSIKDLASYMVSNSQTAEKMKSFRIISRIKSLTEEVKI